MFCGVAITLALNAATHAYNFDAGDMSVYPAYSITIPQAPLRRDSGIPIRLPPVRRSQASVKNPFNPGKLRKNPLVARGSWILTVPRPLPPIQLIAAEDGDTLKIDI
jgi:hypothetical protein